MVLPILHSRKLSDTRVLAMVAWTLRSPLAPSPTEEAVMRPITFLKRSSGRRCWVLRHVLAVVTSSVAGMVVMCHALQLCFTRISLVPPVTVDGCCTLSTDQWKYSVTDLSNHTAFNTLVQEFVNRGANVL